MQETRSFLTSLLQLEPRALFQPHCTALLDKAAAPSLLLSDIFGTASALQVRHQAFTMTSGPSCTPTSIGSSGSAVHTLIQCLLPNSKARTGKPCNTPFLLLLCQKHCALGWCVPALPRSQEMLVLHEVIGISNSSGRNRLCVKHPQFQP